MTRGEDPYSETRLPTYYQRTVAFDGYDDYLVFSPEVGATHGQESLDSLTSTMTLIVAFRTDGGGGGRDGRGGWILSTNNLFSPGQQPTGPKGFGLYIDLPYALNWSNGYDAESVRLHVYEWLQCLPLLALIESCRRPIYIPNNRLLVGLFL